MSSCSSDSEILNDKEKEWLHSQKAIKVAIYPYYPPYQLLDDNGEVDGVFSEYLELIEKKIGFQFEEVIFDTWPALMDAVRAGEVDMITEMHPTEDRESYLNFYARIFETPHVLVTRNDINYGNRIKDFYNKTIILPKDYAVAENIKQRYPKLNLISGKDDITCLKRLNSGEFEGYIGPRAVVHYQIKTQNLDNLKIVAKTEFNYSSGIAVFQKNTILNSIIDKATRNISREETEEITNNWLFTVVTPFYRTTNFFVAVISGVIVLLLLFLGINTYLKNTIRQRTKELRIAKENAEESDRLKTNFIRNISHEIRTPMNGIIGFSKFLDKPDLTEVEQREYSQIIINSGKQLMSIIEDILEISKLKAKQVKLYPEKTDLEVVLNNLYSVYSSKAKEKQLDFTIEGKLPSGALIYIDKKKLNKILRNLIDNAIKFTNKGKVELTYEVKNSLLFIKVRDTGIGIHPRDQQEIFDSFSQSEIEISKNHGGLGLGLTIAKENTTLLGGHLAMESQLNKGTTFVLSIPYNPIKDEQLKKKEIEQKPNPNTSPDKHIVLIAEDGEVNFLFLKMVLTKLPDYNFIIHRAQNGQEAVEICKANDSIDLVLMDIKMPVMDGYEATSQIKKLRPELPIIAQTAYSTEEDIERALASGCDDFVSKPVDSEILKPKLLKFFKP